MTSLRHVGIVVRDLDRALGFYRDLLGFQEARAMDEHGPFLDAILGLQGARVRTVKLQAPAGGAQVELLAFEQPAIEIAPSPSLYRSGPTHIAVTVEDIDDLYERMHSAGVEFTTVPRASPDGRARVTFCRDPDGTYVELVELVAA